MSLDVHTDQSALQSDSPLPIAAGTKSAPAIHSIFANASRIADGVSNWILNNFASLFGRQKLVFLLITVISIPSIIIAAHFSTRYLIIHARQVNKNYLNSIVYYPALPTLTHFDPVFTRPLLTAQSRRFWFSTRSLEADLLYQPWSKYVERTATMLISENRPINASELLFFNRQYDEEFKIIRAFAKGRLVSPSKEPSYYDDDSGADEQPSPEQRLSRILWYLDFYYINPIGRLLSSNQFVRASVMAKEAARRVRAVDGLIGPQLNSDVINKKNKIILLEILLDNPVALHVFDPNIFFNIVTEDFPDSRYDELLQAKVPPEATATKSYWLAIYAFRAKRYDLAFTHFEAVTSNKLASRQLRELALFMKARTAFWISHGACGPSQSGNREIHAPSAFLSGRAGSATTAQNIWSNAAKIIADTKEHIKSRELLIDIDYYVNQMKQFRCHGPANPASSNRSTR